MEQNDLFLSRPSTLHYSSEIHPYVGEFYYLCSYEATGIFTFVRDLDVVRFGAERAIDRGVG